jgi:hypothetical protein
LTEAFYLSTLALKMKKLRSLLWICLFLCVGCATVPPPQKITDPVQFSNLVSYYYMKPEPAQVPAMLNALLEGGFVSWPDSIASYTGFFAEIFHQNQDRVGKWVGNLHPQGTSQTIFLLYAIALSDIPGKTMLMQKLETVSGVSLSAGPFPHLMGAPITRLKPAGAADLDLLWGAFMASGNERYVLKIIDALQYLDATGDRNDFMLGFAAYWSLSSNAKQHQKVKEICKRELSSSSGRKAELLGEILNLERL